MSEVKIPQFAALLVMPSKPVAPERPKRGVNPNPRSHKKAPKAVAPSEGELAQPITRNWKHGEYKHDTAMRISLDRARAAQPPIISLAGSPTDPMKFDNREG